MKQEAARENHRFLPVVTALVFIVLIFNTVLLARTTGFLKLPGEMSRLEMARAVGEMVVDYYEKQASEADVLSNSAVRDVLAQMKFELDKAGTVDDIIKVQSQYGDRLQEVVMREQENLRRETILGIINDDPNVKGFTGETILGVTKTENDGVVIDDKAGVLSEQTINSIKHNELMKGAWPLIEVRVAGGKAELVTARTLIDRLKIYESELESLRMKLQELRTAAGYSELAAPGVVVKMYDAQEGYSTVDIVHDRDVRDVVNELFAAGAAGVSVGGQRLIATTSVRCAGPVILVNQQPISVNPIVINAVGDPQILASSLDLIISQLKEFGIRVEVELQEQVLVPPFKEKK